MKKILTLILTVYFYQTLSAQFTYNVAYHVDGVSPGGLNLESDITTTGWTNIINSPQLTNTWSPTTAIPFAFDFYGMPVTHFKASQNGVITFDTGTTILPGANDSLPSANFPDKAIGFWDEFTATAPTGNNDNIGIKTFGTAPNRQFWIKWFSFEMGNPTVGFNYFAIVLEETTNKVYVADLYSATTPPLSLTVGVQLNSTIAVQYGSGNNTPNGGNSSAFLSNNDFWAFTPVALVIDDIGVTSIDNPVNPTTAGMQNVNVTIENYGDNTIDSVSVGWEVNGNLQTAVPFYGIIAPDSTVSLNLGMFNFPPGISNLKTWTFNPNGNLDADLSNDTLETTICTALAGTYIIGGATSDFITIAKAIMMLETCGVNGPVTFNLSPGVYVGGLEIGPINGANAINTVIFDGTDTSLVTVIHNGANPNAVFLLNGADYFTFTDLTIVNTGNTDAWGIRLTNGADWNTISNNRFLMSMAATLDVVGVVATNSATSANGLGTNANHTRVLNNHFLGGDEAIHFYGDNSISLNSDNQTIGNIISMAYDHGIYYNDQDSALISGNQITDMRNVSGGDGIYTLDLMNFSIMGNTIYVPDYGIYVADGNFDGVPIDHGKIVNNMVRSTGDYGIYLDEIELSDIYHNTSFGNPGIRINDFTDLDIRNNIFVGQSNDYAFEADEDIGNEIIDYNLYFVVPGNSVFVKDGSNTYGDLASWQGAQTTLNINSLEADPIFVEPNTDLHVIGVLANDTGDNLVGVPFDVDGEIRPQAPSIAVDIGADEYTPAANDALVAGLFTPLIDCGDSTTNISIIISGMGTDTITTISVFANISGSLTTTIADTVGTNIGFGQSDTITVGSINTFLGGIYDLEVYVSLTGDEDKSNDTSYFTLIRFSSVLPTAVAEPGCAGDSTYLVGTGDGFPIAWFDSLTGGNLLAIGDTFWTPILSGNISYYVGYNNQPGICTDKRTEVLVTVDTAAQANFSYSSNELITTFTDQSIGNTDSVIYDFGDGNYSDDLNPVYTYADTGIYTVCQVAYSSCGPDTFCQDLTINCIPSEADFRVSLVSLTATFSDSSANADSVLYDFGDDNSSTDTNPVHTYAASGIYTVCQVAYNSCRPDTNCMDISVIATGIDDIPGLSRLNIYPNPNHGVFQIEVGVDFYAELIIEVHTLRGKEIFKKDLGTINGLIREEINTTNLSKGVYLIRFTLNGKSVTRKFLIDS